MLKAALRGVKLGPGMLNSPSVGVFSTPA